MCMTETAPAPETNAEELVGPAHDLIQVCNFLTEGTNRDGDQIFYQVFEEETGLATMKAARRFAEGLRARIPKTICKIEQSGRRVILTPVDPITFI